MTTEPFPSEEESVDTTRVFDDNPEEISFAEVKASLQLPQGSSIAEYQNVHMIGFGGFGSIFSAQEAGLNRKIALKILRPRYRRQRVRIDSLIREARVGARIDHPNIVPVHQLGVFEDAGVFFSMKQIGGETLRSVLHHLRENRPGYRRKYTLHRLLEIFISACSGVGYAHYNGTLHCDLKPENLMIGNFGEVFVMDWGMARYLPELDHAEKKSDYLVETETSEAPLGGTPVFMTPEHLSLSSHEPAVSSDIYALGAILYTILTWQDAPYDTSLSLEELQKKIVQGKLIPPRKLAPATQPTPRELEAICLKAMARNPQNRYHSVEELVTDIRNYQDGYPVAAYSPLPWYRLGKFLRRRPLVPLTLLIAAFTWFGFELYNQFNEYLSANAFAELADTSFTNGMNHRGSVRRIQKLLRHGVGNAEIFQNQESTLQRNLIDMETDFASALEYLARIPEQQRDRKAAILMTGEIFKNLLNIRINMRDEEGIRRISQRYTHRWKNLLDAARRRDARLNWLLRRAESCRGRLEINTNAPGDWEMELTSREKSLPSECSSFTGKYALTQANTVLVLPSGTYQMHFKNTHSGRTFEAPLRINTAWRSQLQLFFPKIFPENLPRRTPDGRLKPAAQIYPFPVDVAYLPGGCFRHEPDQNNHFTRRSSLPSFFIARYEVSIGEYLHFWQQLSPQEKKLYCYQTGFRRNQRLWNRHGQLPPGIDPRRPITGITGEAAEAFCHYLSRQLGVPVRLPTRREWEKAARGIDGRPYPWGVHYKTGNALLADANWELYRKYQNGAPGGVMKHDVSVYGVHDLAGNVREYVAPFHRNGVTLYGVVGGSFVTPPELAINTNIFYTASTANDVGFRYVIEIPGAAADVQEEK